MRRMSRRTFVQASTGLTVANFLPFGARRAFAATLEERVVAAAKPLGAADVTGMIWSPYLVPMQPVIAEFKKQTGIGVGGVQDISIFDAPQRAMAEALSRSPQFDFIHIDSNMIPSLASAGYLEPLDEYMKKADFKIEAVADYANFMTYKGQTYGVPTDGNVHIQYVRKDLIENPDNKKRFADKYGKELDVPGRPGRTISGSRRRCMDPSKDLYGSGNLRNRANGPTWWYMIFYSAGGFTVRRRHEPDAEHAGRPIRRRHLSAGQEGRASGIGRLGHAADDSRASPQGHVVSCQYWDGTAKLNENPEKSKTRGQVAVRPGAGLGFLRQAHPPVDLLAARRAADQQVQPAQGAGRLLSRCGSARARTASRSCPTR